MIAEPDPATASPNGPATPRPTGNSETCVAASACHTARCSQSEKTPCNAKGQQKAHKDRLPICLCMCVCIYYIYICLCVCCSPIPHACMHRPMHPYIHTYIHTYIGHDKGVDICIHVERKKVINTTEEFNGAIASMIAFLCTRIPRLVSEGRRMVWLEYI